MDALVLKWAFRHRTLGVEECESLNDAVSQAWGAADAGAESLAFIEAWDGTSHLILHADKVKKHPRWKALDAAERAAVRKPSEWVAVVEVSTPTGDPARLDWYTSLTQAESAAARLRGRLNDRVTVRQLQNGRVVRG